MIVPVNLAHFFGVTILLGSLGLVVACGNTLTNVPNDSVLRNNKPQPTCQITFSELGVCGALDWTKKPSADAKGAFTLKFWSQSTSAAGGPYLDLPGDLDVKLWMPAMGHGSSPVTVKRLADVQGRAVPGIYLVEDVYFVMSGHWEIQLQTKSGTKTYSAKTNFDI